MICIIKKYRRNLKQHMARGTQILLIMFDLFLFIEYIETKLDIV